MILIFLPTIGIVTVLPTYSLYLKPEGNNLLVPPDTLFLDIKNFLYQVYLQRPDVFAELKLPLPRDIRLHN